MQKAPQHSAIQINPHRKQSRPKQAHDPRIRGTPRQLSGKPPLPLARIIIVEDMRRAVMPARKYPMAEFQPHAWISLNITHVPCFNAVLCNKPELIAHASVTHRSTSWLSRLAADSFKKCISRPSDTDCKQEFDRRIEKIFLQQMNNPMLHFGASPAPIVGN
jgi:hypothetical protein